MNRVLEDYQKWEENENKLAAIFPERVTSNGYLRQKLDYLEKIQHKYGGTRSLEEKMTLTLIGDQVKAIEKQVYPKSFLAFFFRLFRPLRQKRDVQIDLQQDNTHNEGLKRQLQGMGLGSAVPLMDRKIQEGARDITVPVTYYTPAKERVDLNLPYRKNEEGRYIQMGIKATLTTGESDKQVRSHFFSADPSLTALKVENLLAGRALQQADGSWKQLDFTDREADGNYKEKVFPATYGFDLKAELLKLPRRFSLQDAIEKLSQGSDYFFSANIDGKQQDYRVSADPSSRRILHFDNTGTEISAVTLKPFRHMEEIKHKEDLGLAEGLKEEKRGKMYVVRT